MLARSVQVGPPGESHRDDVRFDLTVESGFNDGLAFPFTYLAIAAVGQTALGGWLGDWALVDVLWRIAAGVAVGVAVGRGGRVRTSSATPTRSSANGHATRRAARRTRGWS